MRERHARWSLELVEHTTPDWDLGSRKREWLDLLDREHDNVRSALLWAIDANDAEVALRLAAALQGFWLVRSYRTEGRHWLDRALACAGVEAATIPARLVVLCAAAVFAYTQGDYPRAAKGAEEWLQHARRVSDPFAEADALNLLGVIARAEGESERAMELLDRALAIFRQCDVKWGIALALCNLGTVACGRGDLDAAEPLLEEALTLERELEDAYMIAATLGDLGVVATDRGDRARAGALFAESLAFWSEAGTKEGFADTLARVATLATRGGGCEPAARLFGAAEALCEAIDYRYERQDQARYQRAGATARADLGETAFQLAWEAGYALSLEQAIAEALVLTTSPTSPVASPPDPEARLTPRELDVLLLLVQGRSDREMGDALGISHRTVETHVTNLLNKLGSTTRTAAAATAVRRGLA